MLNVLATFLVSVAALLSVPILFFLIEVTAAFIAKRDEPKQLPVQLGNTRTVVLVPAHNESTGILPTLQDIKPQLNDGDRLVVIADNCSDDTASIATAAGAKVIVRNEPTRIGKGFALDWGITFLKSNPPDFVIFIDADCRVHADAIESLKSACHLRHRPLQAAIMMKADLDARSDYGLSEFAWIIKNWVRPLGLWHLHCPTQLTGTGMIIPWAALQKVSIANGALAEDLQFGLDLAAAGTAAEFLPSVVGSSEFPPCHTSTVTQRDRWVTGHINTITRSLVRYLFLAIKKRNVDLLLLCLDMAVPPLSLLAATQAVVITAALIFSIFGISQAALIISGLSLGAFLFAIFLAWLKFARGILTIHSVSGIFPRLTATLWILALILTGKAEGRWIRAERKKSLDKTRAGSE